MPKKFMADDHGHWNFEAGYVTGKIARIHASDFDYKGRIHHASEDDLLHEIKSKKTDHIVGHKESVRDHA